MEETLGKRIAGNRKRLGMTQDALAEQLGITAQAVSKWENDQSCPDITMLPKLARIFGTTTDELLGLEPAPASEEAEELELPARTAPSKPDPSGEAEEGKLEYHWDSGRKASLALALWVLLVGGILFIVNIPSLRGSFWDILWPSGLLLFGLFGLYPRFSAARLGCSLIGLYSLVNTIVVLPIRLNDELVFPASLLILGFGLLIDALRKPKHGSRNLCGNGRISHSSEAGPYGKEGSYCTYQEETFECAAGFGEQRYLIQLPRLSGGKAELGFGELTVDLSGCGGGDPGILQCLLWQYHHPLHLVFLRAAAGGKEPFRLRFLRFPQRALATVFAFFCNSSKCSCFFENTMVEYK